MKDQELFIGKSRSLNGNDFLALVSELFPKSYFLALLFLFLAVPYGTQAQEQVSLDWALHDVGKVRQVLNNQGSFGSGQTDYPGLLQSEFPPGSFEEHIGTGGIWYGDITADGDTLVSSAGGWASPNEFYPTGAPWDTMWVVQQGDTVDIPYLQTDSYTALSDQDIITRYNDYGTASLQRTAHEPLYLDVIQRSYAWSSPPLDEFIIYRYQVIPTRHDLDSAYVNLFMDGNIGYRTEGWDFALDDYSEFEESTHTAFALDAPGGPDGDAVSHLANRLYPPEDIDQNKLDWSFTWYPGQVVASRDPERFERMANGGIQSDQVQQTGSQYSVSFGPVNAEVGDTLSFYMAQVNGFGMDSLQQNLDIADFVIEKDFKLPSAPPSPEVSVQPKSREVVLEWGDGAEDYKDPNRSDSVDKPFEGYRVYKSTQSRSGPWTLLAEFDIQDNEFGQNTGIRHKFTDTGLMNNVEYYYAVTAFSKQDTVLGFPSQETSARSNAEEVVPGTTSPNEVGQVAVVPNPYRGDLDYNSMNPPWERPPETRERWLEQDRRIQFINLPQNSIIKIYTLSGELVETLEHTDKSKGFEDWNLTSKVNQAVASGIYLFTVKNRNTGNVQTGKFVIIK